MIEMERSAADAKQEEIYRVAYHLFSQRPDWARFFREILGLNGLIRRSYPSSEALADFERTETYQNIQQLLKSLRDRRRDGPTSREATRVVTVRLPKSVHEALRAEAHEHRTSMNKLCISKLLQFIDQELVPVE